MKKYLALTLVFTIFLLFIELSSSQKIEYSGNFRIVHNEKEGIWGKDPKISLELVRTLGGLDVEDENLAFNLPRDVVIDSQGNTYILDGKNNNIVKLNQDGEYLGTIGRGGQGPGDFNLPYSMDIDSSDLLYINDFANRRIQILSTKGDFQKVIRLHKLKLSTIRILRSGLIALGGYLDVRWSLASDNRKKLPKLIEVLERKGKIQLTFGNLKDFDNRLVNWEANVIVYDVDNDDNFYISFTRQNRIEKYSHDGILLLRIDRILNYDTKVLDKGFVKRSGGGVTVSAPTMNQVSEGIAVDGKGRIWVITLNRQLRPEERSQIVSVGGTTKRIQTAEYKKMDIYKLEIFDNDGFLLGNILLNHIAHNIRIQKGYLFIFDLENAQIFQYKIEEN